MLHRVLFISSRVNNLKRIFLRKVFVILTKSGTRLSTGTSSSLHLFTFNSSNQCCTMSTTTTTNNKRTAETGGDVLLGDAATTPKTAKNGNHSDATEPIKEFVRDKDGNIMSWFHLLDAPTKSASDKKDYRLCSREFIFSIRSFFI